MHDFNSHVYHYYFLNLTFWNHKTKQHLRRKLWYPGCDQMGLFLSGDNGTIDGQGALWWEKFHKGQLMYTRPYLIEIMYSENVQISNLTLLNSPSWNIHPVYSRFSSTLFQLTPLHFTWFCFTLRVKCIIGTCDFTLTKRESSDDNSYSNVGFKSCRSMSIRLYR